MSDSDRPSDDTSDGVADAVSDAHGSRLPPVPEALLGPLLQWTGEALRTLKAQEVPAALRPMLSFDRRGFGNAAARTQLLRALEADEEFRERVFEAIGGRSEVSATLRDWDPARAVELAEDSVGRADLDLFTSSLVLARPEGWEMGVGVALALFGRHRSEQLVADDRQAFDTQVAKAKEAQRRAEGEAERRRTEAERLGAELKDERASRRQREEAAQQEAEAAKKRVDELEAALAEARDIADRAQGLARNEAQRAADLETHAREARAEAARARAAAERGEAAATAPSESPLSSEEVELLERAGEIARRLTTGGPATSGGTSSLPEVPAIPEALEDAASDGGSAPRLTRRARVELPGGLVGPSLAGLRAALSEGDPAVVIDGYNVSMLAWGDDPPDTQRQRLCALLERLHLRTSRSITVVFDGADVEGVRPPRRPGVRVVFSAQGEEADDVVIREVRNMPLERAAIVVSSDRKVQFHAEEAGAMAVPSNVFLEFLRK